MSFSSDCDRSLHAETIARSLAACQGADYDRLPPVDRDVYRRQAHIAIRTLDRTAVSVAETFGADAMRNELCRFWPIMGGPNVWQRLEAFREALRVYHDRLASGLPREHASVEQAPFPETQTERHLRLVALGELDGGRE